MLTDLENYGYTVIEEFEGFREGSRVRSAGQRYPEAILYGTGTVQKVYRHEGSKWEKIYRTPDVEMVVVWDAEDRAPSVLAHYGAELATEPESV